MNIDELLDSERRRPGFSPAAREAMWRGITASLAGTAVAAAATTAAASAAPSAVSAVAPRVASKLARLKLGALLSAAAIGGAGAGAAAHARWADPIVVTVEAPKPAAPALTTSASPAPAEQAAPSEVPAQAAPPTSAKTAAPARARASSAAPPRDPALARERTLIDMARTALSRGDAPAALASLDAHAREFPKSQLGEEREVLAVQALAASNRMNEARRRAAAFRATYPKSPLSSVVDEATAGQ